MSKEAPRAESIPDSITKPLQKDIARRLKEATDYDEIISLMAQLTDNYCIKVHRTDNTPFINLGHIPGVPSNSSKIPDVAAMVDTRNIPLRRVIREVHQYGHPQTQRYYLVPIRAALVIPTLPEVAAIEGPKKGFNPRIKRDQRVHAALLEPLVRSLGLAQIA